MTYLPQLRDSLLEAAERRRHPGIPRRRGWPRPSLGGVGALLGAVAAVVVAIVALALPHHRASSGGMAGRRPSPLTDPRASAQKLLSEVIVPGGAVRTGLRPGVPADLWSPVDPVAVAHRIDLHAVWRIPGTLEKLQRFIDAHRPPGAEQSSGSAAASEDTLTSWSEDLTFRVGPHSMSWRELTLQADRVAGGGTFLRADAQAGPLIPRPASERLPGIDRVVIWANGTHERTRTFVTMPPAVKSLVRTFNAMLLQQPGQRPACGPPGQHAVTYRFYRAGERNPVATATLNPTCGVFQDIRIAGKQQPSLALGFPPALDVSQAITLLSPGVTPPGARPGQSRSAGATGTVSTGTVSSATTATASSPPPAR